MSRARLLIDFLRTGRTFRYGPHRSQRADLYLPAAARSRASPPASYPVMVTIHGGSWQKGYGKIVMRGLVADLVRRGFAVWNIEYRRLGEGGGWPATFADVAAAIDHLATLESPLLLDDVSVLGHSAGGHLALWATGRERLRDGEPGAAPAVAIARAYIQAGVCDLAGAYRMWRGGAVRALMGGSPEEHPGRYAVADPIAQIPLEQPVLLVHGVVDEVVSIELSRRYRHLARGAGADVELIEIEGAAGSHRAHLDPRGAAWGALARRLPETAHAVSR